MNIIYKRREVFDSHGSTFSTILCITRHWPQHASLTSEQQRAACEQLLLRFSKLARMFDVLKHTTLVLDSSAAIDLMSDETCRMLECEHAIVHIVDGDRVLLRPQTLRHPRLQLGRVATKNAAAQRALQNATGLFKFGAHFVSHITANSWLAQVSKFDA